MSRRMLIQPVTRIEGHAKISIQLDDAGEVQSARFHVDRVPRLREDVRRPAVPGDAGTDVARLRHLPGEPCAGEFQSGRHAAGRRRSPVAAEKQRRLVNYAQILQSHALSFFHLSVARSAAGHGCAGGANAISSACSNSDPRFSAPRNPAAAVRPAHHRTGGRQAHPSGLERSGRRAPTASRLRSAMRFSTWIPEALESSGDGARPAEGDPRFVPRGDRAHGQFPVAVPRRR